MDSLQFLTLQFINFFSYQDPQGQGSLYMHKESLDIQMTKKHMKRCSTSLITRDQVRSDQSLDLGLVPGSEKSPDFSFVS